MKTRVQTCQTDMRITAGRRRSSSVPTGEIVQRRGYIPPRPMASMLQAIIDDPTPGPSVVPEGDLTPGKEAALTGDARKKLRQVLVDAYDHDNQGWGTVQKWLDWDIIEYCMAG